MSQSFKLQSWFALPLNSPVIWSWSPTLMHSFVYLFCTNIVTFSFLEFLHHQSFQSFIERLINHIFAIFCFLKNLFQKFLHSILTSEILNWFTKFVIVMFNKLVYKHNHNLYASDKVLCVHGLKISINAKWKWNLSV